MDAVRRFSLLATAGSLGIAVMLGTVSARPSISATSADELVRATAYYDSTIVLARQARPTGTRGDVLTIGLGYLERLRVGMASPFRLADEALHDPRVDSASNARIAWAVLGRLRRGEAYVIEPAVLDGAGPWSRDGHGATGAAHVALIERTIAKATDPRAGELTVRLAYTLAASKGKIAPAAPDIAAEVAALVRDRLVATRDLRDLMADAAARRENLLRLLVQRRANREFRVEQPSMLPLTSALRVEAIDAVPATLAAIDTLDRVTALPEPGATRSLIGEHFADRLSTLGERQPSIAQVVVTLRSHPRASLEATNGETLVAAHAVALAHGTRTRDNALATLASAVALRPYNQAMPWFVGDRGADVSELAAEFGIASVTFARSVPTAWRPFYLRELRDGIRDMQEVFPALSVVGLNVSFGNAGLPDSALAMHDPRSRTLELTVATSAGTVAHELAHDLDWQTSRRMFARAGGYSTDRAMREQRGALAASVRALADARPSPSAPGGAPIASLPDRPAEVFARGVDWFTASSLALRGRMNGFLTAVQDVALPGYAAGAPAAVGSTATGSLVSALDQMTYISDSVQAGFENTWSDIATLDPVLLVRRVLGTPMLRTTHAATGLGALLPPLRASLCMDESSTEAAARARLAALAVEARAQGIAARRARYRFPGASADWTNGMLGVAPWNPVPADRLVASLSASLVAELRNTIGDRAVVPAVPAAFVSDDGVCPALAR